MVTAPEGTQAGVVELMVLISEPVSGVLVDQPELTLQTCAEAVEALTFAATPWKGAATVIPEEGVLAKFAGSQRNGSRFVNVVAVVEKLRAVSGRAVSSLLRAVPLCSTISRAFCMLALTVPVAVFNSGCTICAVVQVNAAERTRVQAAEVVETVVRGVVLPAAPTSARVVAVPAVAVLIVPSKKQVGVASYF